MNHPVGELGVGPTLDIGESSWIYRRFMNIEQYRVPLGPITAVHPDMNRTERRKDKHAGTRWFLPISAHHHVDILENFGGKIIEL